MKDRIPNIRVLRGDITRVPATIIVNAANRELRAGGGVCGAIHAAAGRRLEAACKKFSPISTGDVAVTKAYDISQVEYVFHTVGPVWQGGLNGEAFLLDRCYDRCMKMAYNMFNHDPMPNVSISFPCISTGIYGFSQELAAKIALYAVFRAPSDGITVNFVCFTQADFDIYASIAKMLDPWGDLISIEELPPQDSHGSHAMAKSDFDNFNARMRNREGEDL